MKFVTPALMNEKKRPKGIRGLFSKPELQDAFYQARHRERDLLLAWIEGNRLGSVHTFPCILQEDGVLYVFESVRGKACRQRQEEMLRRWNEVITPETAREDFEVTRLTETEFDLFYAQYRRQDSDQQNPPCEES